MYRRLVLFGLSVVALALIALVIPLALVARDIARSEHLAEVVAVARETSVKWQQAATEGPVSLPEVVAAVGYEDGSTTLIPPLGPSYGPAVSPVVDTAVAAARQGASSTIDTGGGAYVVDAAPLPDGVGVVVLSTTAAEMREGLLPRLAALAAVSLILLALAGAAAWMLARRTAQPIKQLATTADAIADGDLTTRVQRTSIAEINDVGRALNRLAGRVQELLADEREAVAELAHQLRTPLTVLAADIDGVTDPDIRQRLQDDLLALQRQTDEIISTVRRTSREGLRAECNAAEVVAQRAAFWQVLADDQNRTTQLSVVAESLPVRLTAQDLETVLDIVLQNVFIHTPEGVDYELDARPVAQGVQVTLRDFGPGLAQVDQHRVGTTGLGLSIATRLVAASGGSLTLRDASPGVSVQILLGPATEAD